MANYTYQPLPPGLILLARILPSADEEAPIECELIPYVLTDSRRGYNLYEALSYHWGSWEKPCEVFIGSDSLPVTRNLHAALASFRDQSLDRIMWIDAFCMNQEDNGERTSQVEYMGYIFAGASCVLVWLGEVTGNPHFDAEAYVTTPNALKLIKSAADILHTEFVLGETNRQAVQILLTRAWFRRIWVTIQPPNRGRSSWLIFDNRSFKKLILRNTSLSRVVVRRLMAGHSVWA